MFKQFKLKENSIVSFKIKLDKVKERTSKLEVRSEDIVLNASQKEKFMRD